MVRAMHVSIYCWLVLFTAVNGTGELDDPSSNMETNRETFELEDFFQTSSASEASVVSHSYTRAIKSKSFKSKDSSSDYGKKGWRNSSFYVKYIKSHSGKKDKKDEQYRKKPRPSTPKSVSTKKPKPASGDKPTTPPSPIEDVSCFKTKEEASDIGSLVLSSMLDSIVRVNCQPTKVCKIMDQYFRSDAIIQFSNGTIAAQGLDQVKDYYIGSYLSGGSFHPSSPPPFSKACSHDLSWTVAKDTITQHNIENEFVMGVNENYSIMDDDAERGRYFSMELFSGGEIGSFQKTVAASASLSLPNQCQRPQIYAVVIQPTFR